MMKKTTKVTEFARRVYGSTVVFRGKVTTYQTLAKAMGQPGAVRAIGNALHCNPYAPQVPCAITW